MGSLDWQAAIESIVKMLIGRMDGRHRADLPLMLVDPCRSGERMQAWRQRQQQQQQQQWWIVSTVDWVAGACGWTVSDKLAHPSARLRRD